MYSIATVIKSKKLKDGSFPVFVRLNLFGKVNYISTGVTVEKKQWDKRLGKLKTLAPLAAQTNSYLTDRVEAVRKLLLVEENLKKSGKILLEMSLPKSANFFDYTNLFLKIREDRGQIETVENYIDYVNQLRRYKQSISVADIDEHWVSGYVKFLGKTNNSGTISRKLKFMRGVMDLAIKSKVTDVNAFKDYTIKSSKPKIKEIPTANDIKLLIESLYTIKARQRLYIQVFLVQFFTRGTRISDVLLMKKNCIIGDTIQIFEKKNKAYKSIGVHEYVKKWADEYNDLIYLFPVLEWKWNDKLSDKENILSRKRAISSGTSLVNKALRLVCAKLGIEKRLTTHCSRHGFTTLAITALSGDLRKVQGLVNHANFKTTENYAHDLQGANYKIEEDLIYKGL